MTMKDTMKVKTPELEKMRRVKEDSQKLGEFIEWMNDNGFHIAEVHAHKGSEGKIGGCYGEHVCDPEWCGSRCEKEISQNCGYHDGEYYGTRLRIEQILAKYFRINLDKCEKERQALLDAIQIPEGK